MAAGKSFLLIIAILVLDPCISMRGFCIIFAVHTERIKG